MTGFSAKDSQIRQMANGHVNPATKVEPITPGVGLLTGSDSKTYIARALFCETAGLLSFEEPDGTARTGFPLVAGANPVGARKVTAFTGTNLWGVRF